MAQLPQEVRKALNALYLEVEASIAEDIDLRVKTAFDDLNQEFISLGELVRKAINEQDPAKKMVLLDQIDAVLESKK